MQHQGGFVARGVIGLGFPLLQQLGCYTKQLQSELLFPAFQFPYPLSA